MENQNFDQFTQKMELPNSKAILILGIVSIPTCCCYGIVGIVCAIIALVMAKTANNLYQANPQDYLPSSYNNMNAGKICAIIGLALGAIFLIMYVVIIATYGWAILSDPEALRDILQQ
ncbi:MAG: DUF4190 domain-containing protein [Prevotellaceae bacterium]|jgi:hypothetical protein|nr:DUF4190 domain-containing protein [Prevotellaceae bacterium]